MKQPIYKICILGDGGVGKTTLVNKFITGLFQDNLKITIGVNFYVKKFDFNEYNITLQLWDLAGENRFRFILPSYLLGAAGAIFMYDITRYSSFKNFFTWMEIFKDCSLKNQKKIPMIMVGGKSDLNFKRAVDKEEVFRVVQSNNILDYLECSAKTGDNVDQIFHKITEIVMKKKELI